MSIPLTKSEGKDSSVKALLESAQLAKEEKLRIIKNLIQQARVAELNYTTLKEEMDSYYIDLPTNPDIMHLGILSEKYAIAQSALSRTSAIEMLAVDNLSRWQRIQNYMLSYIEDYKSEILLEDEVQALKVKQQEATVRIRLKKDFERLSKIQEKTHEAESFMNMVSIKKKDLLSVVTNLSRQVKVIAIEYDATRKL